ncbi:MAG TPA: HD domain-containing protein [Deltaproteobacteria bacterium]|nr:HD domain-containing protein [Deltaproteobacteria bacterium]
MNERVLDMPQELKTQIRYGSWLHDCGKIGMGEVILNKESTLTNDEIEIIRRHPVWGAEVARQAHLSQEVINIIACHHERFDGQGYPTGISGEDIPREARIVSIADVFDAITTDRSYHAKRSVPEAIEVMSFLGGSAFDPDFLDIFLSCVENTYIEIHGDCDYGNRE